MSDFAREADSMVPGALNPGEQVLWTGHCLSRIGQQRKANRVQLWALLFVVPLTAVGAMMVYASLTDNLDGRVVAGSIFMLIGATLLYSLITERTRDGEMYCRKQTVYVLTDQRAFVLKHCLTEVPMRSLPWSLADEVREEGVRPDRRGTVQFLTWDPVEQRWVYSLRFFMVANAEAVADKAMAARNAARG